MRQSHPGLSISLFWPTSSVKPVPKTTKTACAAPEVAPPTRSSLTPNLDSRPTLWSWDKAGLIQSMKITEVQTSPMLTSGAKLLPCGIDAG